MIRVAQVGGEMTETQKRFLTSYLGECWIDHNNPDQLIYARQVYEEEKS